MFGWFLVNLEVTSLGFIFLWLGRTGMGLGLVLGVVGIFVFS